MVVRVLLEPHPRLLAGLLLGPRPLPRPLRLLNHAQLTVARSLQVIKLGDFSKQYYQNIELWKM